MAKTKVQTVGVFNVAFWAGLTLVFAILKLCGMTISWAIVLMPVIFLCIIGIALVLFAWVCLGCARFLLWRLEVLKRKEIERITQIRRGKK